MEDIFSHISKFLSNTIIVQIHSSPNFSIEILLASVVCIIHALLIIEVNNVAQRTSSRIATKLRLKNSLKDVESSYHSLARLQGQAKDDVLQPKPYINYKRLNRKSSNSSSFRWIVPNNGDSTLRANITNNFKDNNDHVEHLLSITPSEYIRHYRDKKRREEGLATCIQSLTSLLEKSLNNQMIIESMSKEAIKKSINTIRENFQNELSVEKYNLGEFQSPSLQSLITRSAERNALRYSLSPSVLGPNDKDSRRNLHLTFSSIENDFRGLKEDGENNDSEKDLQDETFIGDGSYKELDEMYGDKKDDTLDFMENHVIVSA